MGGLIGSNQHSKRLSAVVLEGHFGRQFQKRRQPAALQKVVAEEAVISELVSARWFPCSTGNFREIRRFRAWDSQGRLGFRTKIQSLTDRIP